MYTNMEFNELKQAVNDVLPHAVSCPGLNNTVHKHHLVQRVEIPLTNNYFSFNDKLYHQTIGASKGTILSPEIYDIRLHQILEHLIEKLATQRQNNNPRPIQGRRIDDIGERN